MASRGGSGSDRTSIGASRHGCQSVHSERGGGAHIASLLLRRCAVARSQTVLDGPVPAMTRGPPRRRRSVSPPVYGASAPATSASWASIATLDAASTGMPAACMKKPSPACRSSTVASGEPDPGPRRRPGRRSPARSASRQSRRRRAAPRAARAPCAGGRAPTAARSRTCRAPRAARAAAAGARRPPLGAEVGRLDEHVGTAAHHVGDLVPVAEAHDPGDRRDLGRRRRGPLEPGVQHLGGAVRREDSAPA